MRTTGTQTVADFLATRLLADGGFTVSLFVEGGKLHGYDLHGVDAIPTEGAYIVGGAGPLRADSFNRNPCRVPLDELIAASIARYIDRLITATMLAETLGSTRGGDLMLGGWIDPEDGTVWIEPVSAHPTKEDAFAVATIRGEKAFQDLATGATVYVNPMVPGTYPPLLFRNV